MASGAGCNCCRVTAVAVLLLLLVGGGGIATYFAIAKKGTPDLDETTNSVAEDDETAKSSASNFDDKDKPVSTNNLFYGMSYSPFGLGDNQLCPPYKKKGGLCILADQVQADMRQIAAMTKRIKTYSLNCLVQTKAIVKFARDNGMQVMLGVWVDKDEELNDKELLRLREMMSEYSDPNVITHIIVGNEAVFEGVDQDEVVRMIRRTKETIAGAGVSIPVGSAEIFNQWTGKADGDKKKTDPLLDMAKELDWVGLNIHPYYSGIDPTKKDAGKSVQGAVKALEAYFQDEGLSKKVYVTETGYPTEGSSRTTGEGTAKPSVEGLSEFAQQMEDESRANGTPVYFFEPYNGDWKRRWLPFTELDYNFGIHDCNRNLKKGLVLPTKGAI